MVYNVITMSNLNSSLIKAVAFDFVGVFIKETDFALDSIEQVLESKFGILNTDEAFFSWATLETGLVKEALEEKVKHIVFNLYQIREPDIFSKLPRLKFSTATNHLSYIDDWFKGQSVSKYFDYYVNSAKIGFQKPEPDFYRVLVETIDEPPGEILFVDDNAENCKGAEKYGLKVLHYTRENILSEEILKRI